MLKWLRPILTQKMMLKKKTKPLGYLPDVVENPVANVQNESQNVKRISNFSEDLGLKSPVIQKNIAKKRYTSIVKHSSSRRNRL